MKRRDGFTLIELLITIAIMLILLTLAVVSLRSSQANGRDEERKADAASIARGLEQRYILGNPRASGAEIKKGSYPGNNEILHAMGFDRVGFTPTQIVDGYLPDLLPGVSEKSLSAPGKGLSLDLMCVWACSPAETSSVVNSQTTIDKYIYEPITAAGGICYTTDCVRFNLYYRTEVDNVVHKITSKHQ